MDKVCEAAGQCLYRVGFVSHRHLLLSPRTTEAFAISEKDQNGPQDLLIVPQCSYSHSQGRHGK